MAMSKKMVDFFERIKSTKDEFLFRKLYETPENVLGNKKGFDEIEEEYNNLFSYCELMLNNRLIDFLEVAYNDEEFQNKLDENYQMWRKLSFFLYDSVEFKKCYDMFNDEKMLKLLNDKNALNGFLSNIKNKDELLQIQISIMELYNNYQKFQRLINYGYKEKVIEDFDEIRALNIKGKIDYRITEKVRVEKIEKPRKKEYILKRVEMEDCSEGCNYNDTYLCTYTLRSGFFGIDVIDNLTCENRFVKIMSEKLKKGSIDSLALENTIDIILLSLEIKRYEEPNREFYIKRIGEDVVKSFDLKAAESLLADLVAYRNETLQPVRLVKHDSKINSEQNR